MQKILRIFCSGPKIQPEVFRKSRAEAENFSGRASHADPPVRRHRRLAERALHAPVPTGKSHLGGPARYIAETPYRRRPCFRRASLLTYYVNHQSSASHRLKLNHARHGQQPAAPSLSWRARLPAPQPPTGALPAARFEFYFYNTRSGCCMI